MLTLETQQNQDISHKVQGSPKSIDRFGLLTIGVAVIFISLIFCLFYHYEKKTGEKQLVKDGFSLCSLIADVVRQELMIEDKNRNLNLVDYVVREKGLIYCLVIDNDGIPLIRLGKQVPEKSRKSAESKAEDKGETEYLLTQKRIENQEGEVIYEFSKPVYLNGNRAGMVKIGLALSNYVHFNREVSYLTGSIALSIFGLVFLFYYLLKRLFTPLEQINYHLKQVISEERESPVIEISFKGEIGQLARTMNQILLTHQEKSHKLEEFNTDLEVSNKILLYEKSRMRAILDNLKTGLMLIDPAGRVILANKPARHFLKIEDRGYAGKFGKELFHDQDPKLIQMLSKFYKQENIYAHDSLEIESAEGDTDIVLYYACSYLLDEEDKPLGFLCTITDITSQKRSEQSKHEFVNSVAHELKTPLTTLLSYSEMLLDEEVNDEQSRREFFNSINEETIRLSRLINNLLNISKIEMGSMKINRTLIKVDRLIMDCYKTVRAQAVSKGITFSPEVADKIPNLLLDKDLIEVAILNLLTNAIKYTPALGKVILQGIVEEENVLVRVIDSGPGIPEDEIDHIFDKFFRSSREEIRKEPGTGLGLSLAMNIVKLHKGDIRVESRLGIGSTFTMVLPREEVYI